MRVLIVEDDRDAVVYLREALETANIEVDACYDAKSGYEQACKEKFDVIIVDRLLPAGNGLELISKLRNNGVKTPILILSALSTVEDKVRGLRHGADDYLGKPYAFAELLARIEVLARRTNVTQDATILKVADIEIDRVSHRVWRNGKEVILQPREFLLLEYFMRHEGQVITRNMLLENVWNYHFDPQTNVVDVHISRLRNKIEQPERPQLLSTVRGRGYIFNAE